MKLNTKFPIRNILVSLFFLSTSAVFGMFFLMELIRNIDNNIESEIVGKIVEIRGQAQRRYTNKFLWQRITEDEILFNLDAIRTANNTEAFIVLESTDDSGATIANQIMLGPNTYIILDISNKTRNINFVGGNISASRPDGLTVSTENTVVNTGVGSVHLTRMEGEATSVKVTDGEVNITINGEQTFADTKSLFLIDEASGDVLQEQNPMQPLTPKPNALLLTYGTSRMVDFSWELFAQWDNPVLEVSMNQSFPADLTYRIQAETSSSLELEPGRWYWRITDSQSDNAGSINTFTVGVDRVPALLSPASNLTIPYTQGTSDVLLQWDKAVFVDSYMVEISDTFSFTNLHVAREVNGNIFLMKNLSSGRWWWRVKPRYLRGILDEKILPEPRSFLLEQRKSYEQVKLFTPYDRSVISAVDASDGVDFRWQQQDGIVSYRISISSDPDFDQIVSTANSSRNWETLLLSSEPELYYWRVEATASDNILVPISSTQRFEIKPIVNSIELMDPAPGEGVKLEPYTSHTFLWRNEIAGLSRIIIQKIVGIDKHSVIENLTQDQSYTVFLPGEGTYTWQVQFLDNRGRKLIESPVGDFYISRKFDPPILLNPRPNSHISLTDSTRILLNWSPVLGADAYQVVLSGPDGSMIGSEDRVVGFLQEFVLPNTVGEGSYSVALTSIRDNPPTGESRVSPVLTYNFIIDEIRRYNAAKPISPANNAVIEALSAIKDGVLLRWSQNPSLDSWTVEVNSGRVTRLYQTTVPQLILEDVEAGQYRWMIRSWDKDGQEAPVSRSSRFTVSDVPLPPPPVVNTPKAGEDIDMTGEKSLKFEWQQTENTDYFDIKVYSEESKIPLLHKAGITNSSYTLDNLRILSEGNFVLEIIAYADYPEIGVTRSSIKTRVPFSLSVHIPNKFPKILSDELQYAE